MTVCDTELLNRRRTEILKVALDCFVAKGFVATTMADIAKAAGMSVGNLYNYFSGKSDIVSALAEEEICRTNQTLQKMLSGRMTEDERYELLLEHIRERLNPVRARLTMEIVLETTRNEELARIVRQWDARVHAAIRECRLAFGDSQEGLDLTIRADQALLDGVVFHALMQPDNFDVQAFARVVADRIHGKK
ncbi:MAG: TetR/AcrR family transcriptional regulator [Duodenibacillus sp.]|nr:TetR/AcrR family transcriptional regulator [Duodenibacillus sp.]